MRKSGFHVQQTSNALRQAIDTVQPTLCVSLAHERQFWTEVKTAYPWMFLIGRLFEDGQHWLNIRPETWAERCATLMMPYDAFITFNEPPGIDNSTTDSLAAEHDEWCCRFRRRALELGYQAVALNIATGNVHKNRIVNQYPMICQEFDYIGLHEYSARAMWDQDPHKQRPPEQVPKDEGKKIGYWYCQRYRDWYNGIVQRWPHRAGKVKMVVTECGLAMGVIPGFGDVGWRGQVTEDQYIQSLIWYFTEMNQDDYCSGGAIFMVGAADPAWNSFETLPQTYRLVAIPKATVSQPSPEEPPSQQEEVSMKVYKQGGIEATPTEAQDLLAYHGVEIITPELKAGDKYFKIVALWDKEGPSAFIMQALKEDGTRWGGIEAAWWWPGMKPEDNDIKEAYPTDWHPDADIGLTDAVTGECGPAMGKGAYHGAYDKKGPHQAWIRHPTYPSEMLINIGMVAGTNHRHFDCWWQLTTAGEGEEPEPPPEEEPSPEPQTWTMAVTRKSGLLLLIGTLPTAGVQVTITRVAPGSKPVVLKSGSKSEYGPGGFETPIWHAGEYTIQFLDQIFTVDVPGGQTTYVAFIRIQEPEEPQARLVSVWMSETEAQELLAALQSTPWWDTFTLEPKP